MLEGRKQTCNLKKFLRNSFEGYALIYAEKTSVGPILSQLVSFYTPSEMTESHGAAILRTNYIFHLTIFESVT